MYIYLTMSGGPFALRSSIRKQTSQSSVTVPHILAISWVSTETSILSLCPSVHNPCKGSGNSSTHINTSPFSSALSSLLLTFSEWPSLFFQTRLRRAGGEQERGCTPERRGMEAWRREKEESEWEFSLSLPTHAF